MRDGHVSSAPKLILLDHALNSLGHAEGSLRETKPTADSPEAEALDAIALAKAKVERAMSREKGK